MRAALLLSLVSSGVAYQCAKPHSDLVIGSTTGQTNTTWTSFRNMALDLDTGMFILKGNDPKFPNGANYASIIMDVTSTEGHNSDSFNSVLQEWPHSGGRTGNANPAHLISSASYPTFTRGGCFDEGQNTTVGSIDALTCDFSYSVTGCKTLCSSMQIDVSVYQGLEMSQRTVPSEVYIMTDSGREKHCAFGVTTARSATITTTDVTVSDWNPAGVVTDYTGTCAATSNTEYGTMLNVIKIAKVADTMISGTVLSRWLRVSWSLDGGNGLPYFSFKNSTGLWEEGWPGDEEINGVRFCNYVSTGSMPDVLECVKQEFVTNYVKGTSSKGDQSTASRNSNNAARPYIYAQQSSTSTAKGTMFIDVRLDVGDYVLLPSFVTYEWQYN
eukprot:TRINITY_DN39277_c0_g1_i1.p1 TRINITY_DN39277_c0_g1~~TRINITY_DN39277_c0_g1_i1.p1  ORF type:complete len:419 (+),score=96.98 TRINITY_DN39277_c0_g1_i1:104-1258(+)